MGRVAAVITVEADGNVRCDLGGGDTVTADGFADAGSDCPPLPGDTVALEEGVGVGGYQVSGYHDETAKKAEGGEKRHYARDTDGSPVAEIHIKGDGTVEVTSLVAGGAKVTVKPDGTVDVEGDVTVTGSIGVGGDAEADGEVKAKAGGAQFVTLTGLKVPTPFGPQGPPIPGN